MTITTFQSEGIGARIYSPTGPFGIAGQEPIPQFKPGFVVRGDNEGELVFVLFPVTAAPVVLNQGDVLAWDNSFRAVPLATATATRGMGVGSFFCGGHYGDPAALQGGGFSVTLPTNGVYGMWVQRNGVGLLNVASTAVNANLVNSTTTARQVDAPATATTGSRAILGMAVAPVTGTFTATTTAGSNLLTALSSAQALVPGQLITGTGIPAGTYILDINASGVVMSNTATASGTGVTVTWVNNQLVANTTAGSNVLTGVAGIYGTYPNQIVSGTGIPAGAVITAINGNPGNYTITLSAAATATGTAVTLTLSGYLEGYLRSAYVDKTN